jgi:Co/Zn/Cd efflux system component
MYWVFGVVFLVLFSMLIVSSIRSRFQTPEEIAADTSGLWAAGGLFITAVVFLVYSILVHLG